MATLAASRLTKHYRNRQVVNDVNLTVRSGEVISLLGPNGAGKTTSFYIIIGLIASDSGTVYLDQTELTYQPMHVRARMGLGYLPQEPSIFRRLSVRENIMAILETRPLLGKVHRKRRLEDLLGEFHISHLADHRGDSLSGGERRRVEIARSLASEPKFILFDEPFAGIDPISVLDIQRIIKHLSERGIGVLITDHNVRETLGICDRAYIINDGTVIAEGAPEVVLSDGHARQTYLGQDFKL